MLASKAVVKYLSVYLSCLSANSHNLAFPRAVLRNDFKARRPVHRRLCPSIPGPPHHYTCPSNTCVDRGQNGNSFHPNPNV